MFGLLTNIAETEVVSESTEAAGGISALGLNWKSFLFQLITFVIVLLILKKFAFGKLIDTLEARQKAVDDSLKNAAETEKKLKNAEKTIAKMLSDARKESEAVVNASQKEASQLISAAEQKAAKRAERIVEEAKEQIGLEVSKARNELKAETANLVVMATERIIKEKLSPGSDARLLDAAIDKAARERV